MTSKNISCGLVCLQSFHNRFTSWHFTRTTFCGNITDFNIFFTLFLSLLAVWGLKERKWWWLVLGVLVIGFGNFDYSADSIVLLLIFYLCRNKPILGGVLCVLNYLPVLFTTSANDPLALVVGGHAIGFELFSVLAIPLIYIRTAHNRKVSKWIFYLFYPLHLLGIFVTRTFLHV